MAGDSMMGMGVVGILLILIYIAVPLFVVWAVLAALKSLSQIAEGQKATHEALREIAQQLKER